MSTTKLAALAAVIVASIVLSVAYLDSRGDQHQAALMATVRATALPSEAIEAGVRRASEEVIGRMAQVVENAARAAGSASEAASAASESADRSAAAMESASAVLQQLETSWKDERNARHTVSTPRAPGESVEDWAARHQEAVDALQMVYPPVP